MTITEDRPAYFFYFQIALIELSEGLPSVNKDLFAKISLVEALPAIRQVHSYVFDLPLRWATTPTHPSSGSLGLNLFRVPGPRGSE